MPYVYLYQCTQCRHDLEITVCQEFSLAADGSRGDYQYPEPDLYEWPPRKVSGLWSRLWCPSCRCLTPEILVELESPAEHPVQAFLAAEARGLTGMEPGSCPQCGGETLMELEGLPCPACESGVLRCIGEYEP